ncbi:hypothetical protein ACKWTF_001065 [Chironomus riparius]
MRSLNLIFSVLFAICYDLVDSDQPYVTCINAQNYPCGSSARAVSLVINGTQSRRGAWPWLVTLHKFQTNDLFCGGTLISSNAVVTAAHCMQDKEQKIPITPEEVVIKLGRHNLSMFYERGGVDAYALDIFIHPNWKYFTRNYDSDVAIIKLSAPVTFSDVISPICLWKSNDELPVHFGNIAGYGKSESDAPHEVIPREMEVKIISNEECFLKGPMFAYISSPNTFCAGRDEYSAACSGDSGNGLFVKVNERWYLKGIISASFLDVNNTCDKTADTLFTNVLKFSKWIEEKAPTTVQQVEEDPINQDTTSYGKEIVCYIASWAIYRKEGGRFTVDTFDPELCTTLVYYYAGLDENFKLKSLDPWADLGDDGGLNGYRRFTTLKKSHPHLRVLLCIGGWTEGVEKYSKLASNANLRKEFSIQSAEFLKEYGFDGLSFFWDFPGDSERNGTQADKENFPKLLKEISKIYRQQNLYLSVILRTKDWIVKLAYDLEEISKYVDAINMMTFEYAGNWDRKIGLTAPLQVNLQENDIDSAVNFFIEQKVPKNKIIMGIPFYAQTFKTHLNGSIGDDCEQEGFSGPILKSNYMIGYNEICRMQSQKQWTYKFERLASQMIGKFKENGTTHVAVYDTPRSVANKVKYAMEMNLLGVYAWSIDTDDFISECPTDNTTYADFRGSKPKLPTKKEFPLLRTINEVMKFMNKKRK